ASVASLALGGWYFVSMNYLHSPKPHITWNVFVAFEGLYTLATLLKAPGRQFIGWSADAAIFFVSALHILNLRHAHTTACKERCGD
ncbi:MAG: hypothetical protein VYB96_12165, partial [Pseudomonadota bacterium]|nr:hypothetical protein [Pseudomonadota bacterium]